VARGEDAKSAASAAWRDLLLLRPQNRLGIAYARRDRCLPSRIADRSSRRLIVVDAIRLVPRHELFRARFINGQRFGFGACRAATGLAMARRTCAEACARNEAKRLTNIRIYVGELCQPPRNEHQVCEAAEEPRILRVGRVEDVTQLCRRDRDSVPSDREAGREREVRRHVVVRKHPTCLRLRAAHAPEPSSNRGCDVLSSSDLSVPIEHAGAYGVYDRACIRLAHDAGGREHATIEDQFDDGREPKLLRHVWKVGTTIEATGDDLHLTRLAIRSPRSPATRSD